MRRTEFKFQIWSVSLGVTVCIALPQLAPPTDRSSLLSPTYIHLSIFFLPPHHTEETPRFFILFKYEENAYIGERENWKVFLQVFFFEENHYLSPPPRFRSQEIEGGRKIGKSWNREYRPVVLRTINQYSRGRGETTTTTTTDE